MSIVMKMVLVAALVLGSTAMSLAKSGIKKKPYHARATYAQQSRNVALPRIGPPPEDAWMARASQRSGF